MASGKWWKNTHEYQRIIEILDAYWLSEKDEHFVRVEMYFEHNNGEQQSKRIIWKNPDGKKGERDSLGDDRQYCLMSVDQLCKMGDLPFKEYVLLKYGNNDDSPYADFAYDLQADDWFPIFNYSVLYTDREHERRLEHYLIAKGACKECIETFHELFKEWTHRYSDSEVYRSIKDGSDNEENETS